MTLNCVIALILRMFTEFDSFADRLRHTVVEASAKHRFSVKWAKLTHAAIARSLYDS